MSRRLAFSVALAVCLLPYYARAGNDDEFLMGNRASMLGGAVAATVDDASAIWYNPGGLGGVARDQLDITGTVYALRFYRLPKMISTAQGAARDGSVTEFVALPNSIGYVRRLKPGLALAYGYFAPHANNTVVRENLDDRHGNSQSQWLISSTFAETQQIFAVALGAHVSHQLRLGVSLLGGYSTNLSSVTVFGAAFSEARSQASSSIESTATSTRITAQLALGAQLDLTPHFVLGAALRTPELRLHASSEAFQALSVGSVEDVANPSLMAGSGRIRATLPIAVRRVGRAVLSIAYRYRGGSLALEADIQPALRGVRGEPDRRLLVNARAGWYQRLDKTFALGLGLLTDRAPEAQSYQMGSGTADCYGGTLGVELNDEHLLAPSERAKSLSFTMVFAGRYAYCAGDFGRIVADPRRVSAAPFTTEKGAIYVHELSGYLGSGLRF